MANDYSDDQLRLVARLYYIEGLGQGEIAKFVKVSQAKISRLLTLARERGIVHISVADYESSEKELEARLRRQLNLSVAIVIKAMPDLAPAELRKSTGLFGAPLFEELLKPHSTIAIAGGRSIQALVESLHKSKDKAPTVVQSMGSIDSIISPFDSQELGRVMAQKLGGNFIAMNTPAYVHEKKLRDALQGLKQIRKVANYLSHSDLALVGIGTLENSVFIERGVFAKEDIKELRDAGAVGEICGRFYDMDGNECETRWRDCVMSIEFSQLSQIPLSIGVVAGNGRTEAIRAAIKGGLLKGLIIDEISARALLDSRQTTGKGKRKA